MPDYQNPRKVAEQQISVLMSGLQPNSPAPTVPSISDEQWKPQSPEHDGPQILPNSTDPQDSYDESDDSSSIASVHSEYSDQSQGFQPVEDGGNEPNLIKSNDDHKKLDQERSESLVKYDDSENQKYDFIMGGWDEPLPIAGKKRERSPEPEITHSKRGRPIKKLDYYKLHHGKVARSNVELKTWSEAMTSSEAKQWKRAAREEICALMDMGAFQIISCDKLPKGRTLMKSKWVFKRKYHSDGSLEKHRARCTVKGFSQRAGIDYQETFAPTPRAETGRIMLVLAHRLAWHRRQGDVPSAFLNPDLDIELYMKMPEGFEKEGYIIRIKKSIYGLKQAAALWYDNVKAFLATQGLYPTKADVCLHTNKERDLFVLVHVDDFQVIGPNVSKIKSLMNALHKRYKLKSVKTDLFLGIHISNPDDKTLKLSQGIYARKLLDRHGLADCKTARSPLERLLEPNEGYCSKQLKTEYNSIIGGLQYSANNTRPDIAHAVNHLAIFLSNPSEEHYQAAPRILRYIAKDPDKGIKFTSGKDKPILEAYTDADFSNDPSTSSSTSGSLIRLSSGPICWKSHLQREVVLSTTEAEYIAATETCRLLQWVKILIDSQSAIYVESKLQLADGLTKINSGVEIK